MGNWAWIDGDPVLVFAWIEKNKEGSWRPGYWVRTIERGRRAGHYVVQVSKLVKVEETGTFEWVMVDRVVPPDHVRPVLTREEYDELFRASRKRRR